MTYTDAIAELIDRFDLPAFLARTYPELNINLDRPVDVYHAPWREDRHKSFSLFKKKGSVCWMWRDHADDQSGNIKHFLTLVQGLSESEACNIIREELGGGRASFKRKPVVDFERLARTGKSKPKGTFECVYDYQNAREQLVLQVVRWRDPKSFSQRRRSPDGGWIWGVTEGTYMRTKRGNWRLSEKVPLSERPEKPELQFFESVISPVYRLPEVTTAIRQRRLIVVCDGEKDAETFKALGVVATCSPQGNGNWQPHHAELLKGAYVIVLRDREKHGYHKARNVANSLLLYAERVWGVHAAPERCKDPSAFIAAGGNPEALKAHLRSARLFRPLKHGGFATTTAPQHRKEKPC